GSPTSGRTSAPASIPGSPPASTPPAGRTPRSVTTASKSFVFRHSLLPATFLPSATCHLPPATCRPLLPLQAPQIIHVDRPQVPEQRHQDREPDCRLGGRHRQDEEHEHLSRQVAPEMRE